jgi:hypothetical protein
MADEDEIRGLVEIVYRYGVYDRQGQNAIAGIAKIGGTAIPFVLNVMQNPPKSDLHPRDLADSIQAIFTGLARTAPDALIDLMERDPDTEFMVVWALGNAKGKRSIDALVAALKHKNKWVRWAAVESLPSEVNLQPEVARSSSSSAVVRGRRRTRTRGRTRGRTMSGQTVQPAS